MYYADEVDGIEEISPAVFVNDFDFFSICANSGRIGFWLMVE